MPSTHSPIHPSRTRARALFCVLYERLGGFGLVSFCVDADVDSSFYLLSLSQLWSVSLSLFFRDYSALMGGAMNCYDDFGHSNNNSNGNGNGNGRNSSSGGDSDSGSDFLETSPGVVQGQCQGQGQGQGQGQAQGQRQAQAQGQGQALSQGQGHGQGQPQAGTGSDWFTHQLHLSHDSNPQDHRHRQAHQQLQLQHILQREDQVVVVVATILSFFFFFFFKTNSKQYNIAVH